MLSRIRRSIFSCLLVSAVVSRLDAQDDSSEPQPPEVITRDADGGTTSTTGTQSVGETIASSASSEPGGSDTTTSIATEATSIATSESGTDPECLACLGDQFGDGTDCSIAAVACGADVTGECAMTHGCYYIQGKGPEECCIGLCGESRGLWKFKGEARVDNNLAAEAELLCTLRNL